ncbi:MAG TPA: hypothetical protein VMF89_10240 [Polyangiales bacterium]|nr:hypothetical protein [Polyangiales bacterium]
MKLLVLHGFIQNGQVLRAHLAQLFRALPPHVEAIYPDAPHACSEQSVKRLQAFTGGEQAPPHLCWWNATDDGSLYRGYEASLALLESQVHDGEPFALLGFSQGAVFGAVLTALAERGDFARPRFSVLVAGRVPRAHALQPLFTNTLTTPSLHVWGDRDVLGREEAPKLVDKFSQQTRQVLRWSGPHVIPTFGPASDELVFFISKNSCI